MDVLCGRSAVWWRSVVMSAIMSIDSPNRLCFTLLFILLWWNMCCMTLRFSFLRSFLWWGGCHWCYVLSSSLSVLHHHKIRCGDWTSLTPSRDWIVSSRSLIVKLHENFTETSVHILTHRSVDLGGVCTTSDGFLVAMVRYLLFRFLGFLWRTL